MREYAIELQEIVCIERVVVEANSKEEAEEKARKKFHKHHMGLHTFTGVYCPECEWFIEECECEE